MAERLLTKKNLVSLGLLTAIFHAVLTIFPYFFDVAYWIYVVDYVLIGLVGFSWICFVAKEHIPICFQPAQMILILFFIWYIISCLSMSIRYDNDWVTYNTAGLLNTAIETMMVFPLGYVMVREREYSVGKFFIHIFLLVWTIFISYVLIRIFQRETIPTPNGGAITMYEKSLSLNCNRNTTGAWEMLVFMACCFMVIWSKHGPLKISYSIASAIHYVALSLSNSRVSFLATLIGFMAMTGIAVYLYLENKDKPHRLLLSIIIAFIAGAAFYFLSGLVFDLYNNLTGAKAANRVGQDASLSGREDVWRAAIAGLFTSFRCAIFGVTPMGTPDLIVQMSNGTLSPMYAHNEFLELAVGIGIPGLCIFLVWFYMMMRDSYKLFFVQKDKTQFLVVPVVIICFMLANMMESYLIFYDYTNGYVFFLLCGMLYGKVNEPVATKSLSKQAMRNKERKKKK